MIPLSRRATATSIAALVLLAGGALPAGADEEEAPFEPSPSVVEPSPEPDPTPTEKPREDEATGDESKDDEPKGDEPTSAPNDEHDPQTGPDPKPGSQQKDESSSSDHQSVTIEPLAVEAPVDDTYTVTTGSVLFRLTPSILANDPAGSSVVTYSQPSHGSVTDYLSKTDLFYTADAGYTGTDSFTYTTEGGTATVNITVADNPNRPVDDHVTVPANTSFNQLSLLANDPAGSTLSFFSTHPEHGTALLQDSDAAYTPTPGYVGPDTFTYNTQFGTATVHVTVVDNNSQPVDDSYTVPANSTNFRLSPHPLANDPTGSTFRYATDPGHGSIALLDGQIAYTPTPGYTGPDSFTYATQFGVATVTITVGDVIPAAPEATDDAYPAEQGKQLVVSDADGVLKNDLFTESATATVATGPSHGTVDLSEGGGFTYTPETGYSGEDSFTYTVTGPGGTSSPATVTIAVAPAPPAPVADDDSFLLEDFTYELIVAAPGVLANDSNASGATLEVVSQPEHGTVVLNQDGGFTYTRTADLPAEDSFTYQLAGPGGTSEVATVSLPLPPNPVDADDDSYDVDRGEELVVAAPGFLANDDLGGGDPFVIAVRTQPTNGTVQLGPEFGAFTYTPNTGFSGVDAFEYVVVTDDPLGFGTATVTITVNEPDLRPVAVDDSYPVIEEETLVVDPPGVIGNDPGATGARLLSNPAHGSLDFNDDGSFTYTPDDDYTGTDEFTYVATNDVQVSQGGRAVGGGLLALDSAPANVTLTVLAASDGDDDDDDGDGDSGGDGDSNSDDAEGALPDAGSSIGPVELTAAMLLTFLGAVLVRATRRRGRHAA